MTAARRGRRPRAARLHWRDAAWASLLFGTVGLVLCTALGRGETVVTLWVGQAAVWTLFALLDVEGILRRRIVAGPPRRPARLTRRAFILILAGYELAGVAAVVEAVLLFRLDPVLAFVLALDAAVITALSVVLIRRGLRRSDWPLHIE